MWNGTWSSLVTNAQGQNTSATGINNEILYCGYRFDPETAVYDASTGLMTCGNFQDRNREDSTQYQWMQQDPAQDGSNLYAYCSDAPINKADPYGLWAMDGKWHQCDNGTYEARVCATQKGGETFGDLAKKLTGNPDDASFIKKIDENGDVVDEKASATTVSAAADVGLLIAEMERRIIGEIVKGPGSYTASFGLPYVTVQATQPTGSTTSPAGPKRVRTFGEGLSVREVSAHFDSDQYVAREDCLGAANVVIARALIKSNALPPGSYAKYWTNHPLPLYTVKDTTTKGPPVSGDLVKKGDLVVFRNNPTYLDRHQGETPWLFENTIAMSKSTFWGAGISTTEKVELSLKDVVIAFRTSNVTTMLIYDA